MASEGRISIDVVKEGLKKFKNTKDEDIAVFLNEKAIEFENRKWCSVYLLVNEEMFLDKRFIKIEGYFTLSIKALKLHSEISKSKKKKLLNGMSTEREYAPVILIGQLGKHIDESNDCIGETSIAELLDYAIALIEKVNDIVHCNLVMLECRKWDHLSDSILYHHLTCDQYYIPVSWQT